MVEGTIREAGIPVGDPVEDLPKVVPEGAATVEAVPAAVDRVAVALVVADPLAAIPVAVNPVEAVLEAADPSAPVPVVANPVGAVPVVPVPQASTRV